jgi:hypothetical protein
MGAAGVDEPARPAAESHHVALVGDGTTADRGAAEPHDANRAPIGIKRAPAWFI